MEQERQRRQQPRDTDIAATTCVVFAAGTYFGGRPSVPPNAFVIAADGGLDHAHALGIRADAVIGDFDSISGPVPEQSGTIRLPEEKDDPDLLSALKVGWAKGARTFHIWCARRACRSFHRQYPDPCTSGSPRRHRLPVRRRHRRHRDIGRFALLFRGCRDTRRRAHGIGVLAQRPIDRRHRTRPQVSSRTRHYAQRHGPRRQQRVPDRHPAVVSVGSGTLIVTFPIEAGLPHVERLHAFSGDLGALSTAVSAALATPRQSA